MKKISEMFLVLAVFAVCFFGVRWPLYSMGWDGTDANGHDTDIFVKQPAKPDYLLIARFAGRDVYVPAYGHPGPMYGMISQMGRLTGILVDYKAMTDAAIIRFLKIMVSVGQAAVWCALIAMACFSHNLRRKPMHRALVYGGITALAFSPMAINGSNEFQLDSFFGFILAGAYALALALWNKPGWRSMAAPWAVLITAAFLGLGKNEWTLVLIIAVALLMIFAIVFRLRGMAGWSRQAAACAGLTALGLVAGNLMSWIFEPSLYFSGWQLLFEMIGKASLAKSACAGRFVDMTVARLPFIQVHLVMLLFLAWSLLRVRPFPPPSWLLAALFGAGLFGAFFFSTWGEYPRYFSPAFIVLAVVCVWTSVAWSRNLTPITLAIVLGVFAWWIYGGYVYAHSERLANSCCYGNRDTGALPAADPALPLLHIDDVYRKNGVDFIHVGMGVSGAQELMRQYGQPQRRP